MLMRRDRVIRRVAIAGILLSIVTWVAVFAVPEDVYAIIDLLPLKVIILYAAQILVIWTGVVILWMRHYPTWRRMYSMGFQALTFYAVGGSAISGAISFEWLGVDFKGSFGSVPDESLTVSLILVFLCIVTYALFDLLERKWF